jgi:hypothetical protein
LTRFDFLKSVTELYNYHTFTASTKKPFDTRNQPTSHPSAKTRGPRNRIRTPRLLHKNSQKKDTSQVQIEPVLFVSIPPLADQPPYRVGDVHVGERGGHRRRVRWSSRVGVIWDRQMPVQIVRAGRFM